MVSYLITCVDVYSALQILHYFVQIASSGSSKKACIAVGLWKKKETKTLVKHRFKEMVYAAGAAKRKEKWSCILPVLIYIPSSTALAQIKASSNSAKYCKKSGRSKHSQAKEMKNPTN